MRRRFLSWALLLWAGVCSSTSAAAEVEDRRKQLAADLAEVRNSTDGAAILERQFPGLLRKLLVARLLDPDGKPNQPPRPQTTVQADGRLSCLWHAEIYFDLKTFYEQVVPVLDQVLTAAAAKSDGPVLCESSGDQRYGAGTTLLSHYPVYGRRTWRGPSPPRPTADVPTSHFLLSVGRADKGGTERFRCYLLEGVDYQKCLTAVSLPQYSIKMHVELLTAEGEVVWKDSLAPWKNHLLTDSRNPTRYLPYFVTPLLIDDPNTSQVAHVMSILSPRFGAYESLSREWLIYPRSHEFPTSYGGNSDVVVRGFDCVLDPADLKRIAQVRFYFVDDKPPTPN